MKHPLNERELKDRVVKSIVEGFFKQEHRNDLFLLVSWIILVMAWIPVVYWLLRV